MEAVTIRDCYSTSYNELSLHAGAQILILSKERNNSYSAEYEGNVGIVKQENFIFKKPHAFYKDDMIRRDCESFLMYKEEGTFVIRLSSNSTSGFCLSVKYGDGVNHFKIYRDGNSGKFFILNEQFPSLNKLINYHSSHSVSRNYTLYLNYGEEDEPEPQPVIPNLPTHYVPSQPISPTRSNNYSMMPAIQPAIQNLPNNSFNFQPPQLSQFPPVQQPTFSSVNRVGKTNSSNISNLLNIFDQNPPSSNIKSNNFAQRNQAFNNPPFPNLTESPIPPNFKPPPVPKPRPIYPTYKALYDYTAADVDELTLCTGDILEIIEMYDGSSDWWKARKYDTHEEGLVPRNYIESCD